MENKPSVLYRGLKVDYNSLQNFEFSGVDLKLTMLLLLISMAEKPLPMEMSMVFICLII